jgi:hypothetical protein
VAAVTLTGTPSLSTVLPCSAHHISGLVAGEALVAGDLVYIKSDGKVWKSTGAGVNAAAKVRGMVLVATAVGEACSIYHDVNIRYGAGLTPGADLFVSGATPGLIVDAASTGGTAPCGFVIDATRIRIFGSRY